MGSVRRVGRVGRVGLLYIGQSPKEDYVSFFRAGLPEGTEILQAGAMDDLTLEEIRALPIREGEPILIMQTRDLVTVTASKALVEERLAGKVDLLESLGAEVIVVLCTGKFPSLSSKVLLLEPSEILFKTVVAVSRGRKVGVITPLPEQILQTRVSWLAVGVDPLLEAATPYESLDPVVETALRLKEKGADLIVLDCMGFTDEAKEAVREASGKPTICARTIVRRVLGELA